MGYRNLNVIKTLEDFAGKFIHEVGSLKNSKIYVDEDTSSFIVVSEDTVNKINEMFDEFEKLGYEITRDMQYDDFYYWDQINVKSTTGTEFALYLDLCDEYVRVMSLSFTDDDSKGGRILNGLIDEGKYKISEDDFLPSLITLMSNPINAAAENTPSKELSVNEYIELLETLGYVKKKKGKYYFTDEGESTFVTDMSTISREECLIDEYNNSTWIQRHTKSSHVTFEDATKLVSDNLDRITFWKVRNLYTSNAKETSDMFVV